MSQDVGMNLAVAVACVLLAVAALGALGVYGTWGVGTVQTGGEDMEPEDITEDSAFNKPGGTQDDGFLGSARSGLSMLGSAARWVASIPAIIIGMTNMPRPLAGALGAAAMVAFAWTGANYLRGR